MKKNRIVLLTIFVSLLTFGSCKKADAQGSKSHSSSLSAKAYSEDKPEYKARNSIKLNTNTSNLVDFDSIRNFFTLDFTPEYPDSVFEEAKIKASQKKITATIRL